MNSTETSTRSARFAGQVALVTGGGGGLGETIAKLLAAEGAAVVLADVAVERGEAAATAIRGAGGQASFVELDVTSEPSWAAAVEHTRRAHGRLDVLVNNAGVVSRSSVSSTARSEWQRVMDINLTGPLLGIQAVATAMREGGGGSIVNIGSTAGLIAHPGAAYCASKWGLRGLTRSAALTLLDDRIRVNEVHPAQVRGTGITVNAAPAWRAANDRAMPMQRGADTEEVAQAVLFLASPEASYITGTEIVVDGGSVSLGMARLRAGLQRDAEHAAG